MNLKLRTIIKASVIVCIVIMLLISYFNNINLNEQNTNLNNINESLRSDISDKENTINELSYNNEKLIADIENLKNINNKISNDNATLDAATREMLTKIDELEKEIARLKEEVENKQNAATTPPYRDFKSYMSYKAITDTTSRQWQLQQLATINEYGVRCIDGIPLVAVGTGWGLSVGDIALVTCDNGNSFKIMVGDIKSDRHTDNENKTTMSNGCRLEFIVDIDQLNQYAKIVGSLAVLDEYKGYVVNIEKI